VGEMGKRLKRKTTNKKHESLKSERSVTFGRGKKKGRIKQANKKAGYRKSNQNKRLFPVGGGGEWAGQ